jgi:phage tail-like protein
MPQEDQYSPGLALRFTVEVDGQTLGNFTKVEGLEVEYEVEEYVEGGLNDYVHRLPGRRKFQNIRLTRPLDKDSGKIAAWLSEFAPTATGSPTTAKIEALNANSKVVATWDLADVWPVKYSGPSFAVETSDVASETLELAHHGFVQG